MSTCIWIDSEKLKWIRNWTKKFRLNILNLKCPLQWINLKKGRCTQKIYKIAIEVLNTNLILQLIFNTERLYSTQPKLFQNSISQTNLSSSHWTSDEHWHLWRRTILLIYSTASQFVVLAIYSTQHWTHWNAGVNSTAPQSPHQPLTHHSRATHTARFRTAKTSTAASFYGKATSRCWMPTA